MIPIARTTALLLASGLSRRFGEGDKLVAPFRGKPLAGHVATLIAEMPFAARMAVVPTGEGAIQRLLGDAGFELVRNPRPETGRESSLRLGLAAALAGGPAGVIVFLADMPNVDPALVAALAEAAGPDRPAVSATAGFRSPPLMLPLAWARRALADQGTSVRDALAAAVEHRVPPAMLKDYDTAADLQRDGLEEEG